MNIFNQWYILLTLNFEVLYFLKLRPIFVQNTAISLKPIHFIDKLKLILILQVRNSTAHLTLVKLSANSRSLNFWWNWREEKATKVVIKAVAPRVFCAVRLVLQALSVNQANTKTLGFSYLISKFAD